MNFIKNLKRINELKSEITKELKDNLNNKAEEFGYNIKSIEIIDKVQIIKGGEEIRVTLAIKPERIN